MIKISFDIVGKQWKMLFLDKKKYRKKWGKDSVGITDFDRRKIYISPRGADKETVVHELVHSYLYEFCTRSCDLDDANLEEIFCELMAKRGEEILKKADLILAEYTTAASVVSYASPQPSGAV